MQTYVAPIRRCPQRC